MIETLPRPLRQMLALLLLACAAAAVALIIIMPAANALSTAHAEVTNKREILGRLQSALASRAEPAAQTATNEAAMLSAHFLPGDNDAVRGANLQSALAEILDRHGMRLRTTRALPVRDTGGLRRITIEAGFEATQDQILAILAGIEAHTPTLALTALALTAAPDLTGDAAAAGHHLDVTVEVSGAAPANAQAKE